VTVWSARAPCRVDLGGGTLDIWPLGLFHPGARTVNVAIDIEVGVEVRRGDGFRVAQAGSVVHARDLASLRAEPSARLIAEVCDFLGIDGVDIEISSGSPRGGGLGASSALTICLLAAIGAAAGREQPPSAQLAAEARDLEARMMRLPTGIQDHAPALLGSAVVVEHRIGGSVSRVLPCDLDGLAHHLVVAYSGQSHFSAGNNWSIIRRALDHDPDTDRLLRAIAVAAAAVEAALAAGDFEALGHAVAQEWGHRRQLADEVSTPTIEALLDAARRAGAWGGKACGAGGGGCVVVLAPKARRAEVAQALARAGAEVLEASPSPEGLRTTTC
jgi:D-glycero-alpha-D-manno-heptose-7-phosphate kinase